MDKIVSSPLSYFGGKKWLFKTVYELIPDGETEIFSPFLGGGTIEINLALRGYKVHAYDNYQPLVNFWQQWLSDPEQVKLTAYELLSLYTKDDLNILRTDLSKLSDIEKVAFFLIHNRFAFNGMIGRSILGYGLNPDGEYIRVPSPSSFGLTRLINNWDFWQCTPLSALSVQQGDFESVFWIHNHRFAYIDPPYFDLENSYGGSHENGFNHDTLRELLGSREKWILSYNDHPEAHRLYEGFHIQRINRCKLTSDGKHELLITSPDIATRQLTLL